MSRKRRRSNGDNIDAGDEKENQSENQSEKHFICHWRDLPVVIELQQGNGKGKKVNRKIFRDSKSYGDIFVNLFKQNEILEECCIAFKRNRVTSDGTMTITGYCSQKACKREFVVKYPIAPVEEVRVEVAINGDFHHEGQSKYRKLQGQRRETVINSREPPSSQHDNSVNQLSVAQLVNGNYASAIKTSCARQAMSKNYLSERLHSDPDVDLFLLYKKEQSLPECDRYFWYVSLPTSMLLYHSYSISTYVKLAKKRNLSIHIDATGGVISKTSEKETFLYTINVTKAGEPYNHLSHIPLALFFSQNQHAVKILSLMQEYFGKIFEKNPSARTPKTAVCDGSFALLQSVSLCFNKCKLQDYIYNSCNMINEKGIVDLPNDDCNWTTVLQCSSHLLKDLSIFLSKTPEMKICKADVLKFFCLLQSRNTFFDFLACLRHIFRLLLNKTENELVQKSKNYLIAV